MRRIPIFLFMAVLALCSRLDAQIEVSASINNSVIALNEQAEVRVTVSGNAKSISEPVVPAIDNFQIAGSGRSQNISIVNGSMTSSFVYSYILYPKKTGDFVIPPFTVNYRNTRYSTEPLNIKVVKEKEYNLGAPSAGTAPGAPPEMYVEQDLDLPQAYVGQQVTYVFKFYRRVNLVSNPSFEAPDFKGFIKEDLPPNKTYRANIKGMQYMVTEVRFALFPISSGDYVIPQARLIVTVEDVFSADDFFSRFFSEGKKKALTTSPLEVHIKPLPEEGRPSGFSGAVGEYDVKISLDKQTVKQGEPVTLSVDIEGVGDPKTIKAPELKGLNNFRIYETVSSYNISKKDYRVGGSRSFKTPVIPQVAGEISIPGVEFNYFDPVKGRYVVKKSGLLNMKVTVPDRKDTSGGSETVAEELRVVREDIRYISSGMGREAAEPLYRRKGFWQVEGIPLYMLAVLLASSAFRKKVLEPRSEEIKRKKAFNRIIKEARKHASKGHGPEVYRRIYELSKNIGGPSVGELGDIIKRAQAAVYSPDKESPGDAGADLNRFIRLLRKGLKIAAALLILAGTDCFSSQSSIKKQFDEANENYRTGRFREALDIYKELLEGKHGYEGIYYNIGNTYWRLGEQGKARLFWEKALELNPGNADAYYNREIIAKSIQEKTEPGFLEGLMDSVDSLIGLNNMIISVSAAGWITLFIFMLFYLSRKEVYLWAGAMLLIIFIIAAGLLFVQIGNGQIKEGVVLSAADIYDSPSDNAAVQGTLPEASKVLIVQDKGDWMEIGIKEKNLKIWIKKDKIDII